MVKIPLGRDWIVSKQSWLSGNEINAQLIFSLSYSSCSNLKINLLNCCCNASFVKLIQSCSNELTAKLSNPKISNTPAEDRMSLSFSHMIQVFTSFTTHKKSAPYTVLARASLASCALSGAKSIRISSPRVTIILTVNAVVSLSTSTPNNLAASATVLSSAICAISCPPSLILLSNLTCPKCKIPATILKTISIFPSSHPILLILLSVYFNPSSSVNSRRVGAPPCPVKWK
mmetsp:Transcript_20174/g.33188  ORF Transcript_20174/g.33188 Transcript_20174/m.33188 type:complete len:231 (-) Transcript_20174:1331-2023(-)